MESADPGTARRVDSPSVAATRQRSVPVLLTLVAAVALVAFLGSWGTTGAVDGWYRDAERPWFTPPDSVFAPVWTVLYVMIAAAGWLAWRRGAPLALWWVQLGLNLAWPFVFFAQQWLWLGLAVIVALDLAVAATILVFRRHSGVAAALLLPYLAWTFFATALTAGIAWLN